METKEFEKILNKGKEESNAFFSGIDYASLKNAIGRRISHRKPGGGKPRPFALRLGFAAALVLLAAAVSAAVILGTGEGSKDIQNVALSSQSVSLDDGGDYLLNYFPVTPPNHTEPGLMSVLWQLDNEGSDLVYSTLFEKCDEAYPASDVVFPETNRKLILIFSGDTEAGFIDYRLIGNSNGSINVWWSQDFVPAGVLEVKNGVVVERRGAGGAPAAVSYIVPYDIKDTGELILPVDSLQIKVGEYVLLVGSGLKTLEVSSMNGLFERLEQGDALYGYTETLAYRAKAPGFDVLNLSDQNEYNGCLNINVME